MSRLGKLREFQEGLAQRIRVAGAGAPSTACLAVEAGGEGWRIRLDETAEVLPVPDMTTVPLCRPWFVGLANVHGRLVSVVDFSAFSGTGPTPRSSEARVVVFAERFGAHGGLLVSRVAGLRNADAFEPVAALESGAGSKPWFGSRWRDAEGRDWRDLKLPELIAAEEFLQVVR